ncbi:hypothetical protein Ddye_017800 [Dipteronia dyeriana]|uniref:DUF1985 domain-containing protein n=1 Tax=Dipteronia dyeriana TaxID=168575 RepID=A0AAD9X0U7_9ROSI|nr:hypothetical protein Ddye_017800 [Dipteronia dyeriana]
MLRIGVSSWHPVSSISCRMHPEMKFLGGVIHQLLLRELDHDRPTYEMRFLLGNHMVRFSKVKFYLITGLRFGVVPDRSLYLAVENVIHQRYFPGADEVSLEELRVVLTFREFHESYDVVKLCLIYMLNWILMGVDGRLKIPVWQFRLVEDLNAFVAFLWSAHVYRHSIFSFKHALPRRSEERRQQSQGVVVHFVEGYNIYDICFEVIPQLGIDFGARRITELSPRMLKWELTKQSRGKKLAKIFNARMFTRKEIVPTAFEAVAPYFAGLSEGGSLYIEGNKVHLPTVPDQTSSAQGPEKKGEGGKLNETEASDPSARGDSRADVGRDGEGFRTHTYQDGPPGPDVDFTTGDRTSGYTGGTDKTGGHWEDSNTGEAVWESEAPSPPSIE